MTSPVTAPGTPVARIVLALVMVAMGIYVANGQPPGGAVLGFLLMTGAVVVGTKRMRARLPIWARLATVAAGALVAVAVSFLIHSNAIEAPLFAAPSVPSVSAPASSSQVAAQIERARALARAAVVEQNLPGVSIAVGLASNPQAIVWAEGFGWRDVVSHTPVTPETRFNIGTAAQVVTPSAAASLGLANTGTDTAADWSPEHVGEPEEDFPVFTGIHDGILRPLGLSGPRQPLPGNRATFYVPTTFWKDDTTDPRMGRRLMYMRDLACCAGKMAFSSTPSDLVRFALATKADNVTGTLAGGSVVSLLTRRENGIVVAVASNIAYANTATLAERVADAFAQPQ